MVWTGNRRTSTAQWRALRAAVITRDGGRCHICGKLGADQVDHLTPHASGGTDHPSNLAAIHARPCHAEKSAREGAAARWRHRTERDQEPHPGLRAP